MEGRFHMNLLQKIGLSLVALLLAFASGRYFAPVKIQEKEVVKEVVKAEKQYITTETKKPDGTIITKVEVRDKLQTSKEETKEKIVSNEKPKYKASIIPKYSFDKKDITYSGSISMRVTGPVFIGIYIDPYRKELGIPLTLEF